MLRCPHCREPMTGLDDVCPACSRPRGESDETVHGYVDGAGFAREFGRSSLIDVDADDVVPDGSMVSIARFKNAAEAGYFAHELKHTLEIPVVLSAEENFDALLGQWSARFVMSVPESASDAAIAALEKLIADSETDELYQSGQSFGNRRGLANRGTEFDERLTPPAAELAHSGVNWVPIVLTLAAGSAALWGARKFNHPPQGNVRPVPARGEHVDLWDRLASEPRPWIQQLENGRGIREFRIGPRKDSALFREDADGDGIFETELRFRRTIQN